MYQRKRYLKRRIEDLQAKVEMLEKENFALREETYMSDGVFKHNPLLSWYGKELCLAFGRILAAPRYMKLDFDQYSKYMRDVLDYLKEIRLLEESYQRENQADGRRCRREAGIASNLTRTAPFHPARDGSAPAHNPEEGVHQGRMGAGGCGSKKPDERNRASCSAESHDRDDILIQARHTHLHSCIGYDCIAIIPYFEGGRFRRACPHSPRCADALTSPIRG